MQVRNSENSYGAISIALHWLGALSVAFMLGTGLMMATAANREAYLPWVKFHGSVGILILLLLVARIAWHFIARQPAKLSKNQTLNRMASFVHRALLLLIAMQLVTGPIDIWSGGYPFRVFNQFTVPSLTGDAFKAQHVAIGDFHSYVGLTIGILVALHIAAVLKHVIVDRDRTLARMVGMADTPQSESADPGTHIP